MAYIVNVFAETFSIVLNRWLGRYTSCSTSCTTHSTHIMCGMCRNIFRRLCKCTLSEI